MGCFQHLFVNVTSSPWPVKLSWQHVYTFYLFPFAWWQYCFDATLVNTQTHIHRHEHLLHRLCYSLSQLRN